MRKLLITGSLGFVGFILSACANPAETCAGYGYKPGTVEYADCQRSVAQQNSDRAAAFSRASGNMGVMNQPSMPMPTTTTCRPIAGGATQCSTR
jgi:hypothetical protein